MTLTGNLCANCNLKFFPPRALCEKCHATELSSCKYETEDLLASTLVYRGPGVTFEIPERFSLTRLSNNALGIVRNKLSR